MSESQASVELRQVQDYRFELSFGAGAPVIADEPLPLGQGQGPSPVQLLAAAVGNCLSDSLLFALRKFKQAPEPLRTQARAEVGRNEQGRLRVLGIEVDLHLGVPAAALAHLERVLESFESYCTVTQSVARCIPVQLRVWDSDGQRLR